MGQQSCWPLFLLYEVVQKDGGNSWKADFSEPTGGSTAE